MEIISIYEVKSPHYIGLNFATQLAGFNPTCVLSNFYIKLGCQLGCFQPIHFKSEPLLQEKENGYDNHL